MKVAIIQFPGSNCDQDALWALREDVGVAAEYVWHESTSLLGFDAVFLPGGFSYGDYLRCGAMAARSPIMDEVRRMALGGHPVIGACNGFQILCEMGVLPGSLLLNEQERFVCRDVWLRAENRTSVWTQGVDRVIRMPIAHGEGRYVCDDETLRQLEGDGCIAFRYVNQSGNVVPGVNPNGSRADIAGVLNKQGNILGLMPHPERATKEILGSTDGLLVLNSLKMVSCR